MSTQRDNDKLEELISRTINTEKLQFDAEKWKEKYPKEYQTLISRRDKSTSSLRPNILGIIFGRPVTQLAAAAAVIVVVILLLGRNQEKPNTPISEPSLTAHSPVKIISMGSMRMAYQRGGLDALDQQFRDTLNFLGPRSSRVSIQKLLDGLSMF
jgi:hypothetical protein